MTLAILLILIAVVSLFIVSGIAVSRSLVPHTKDAPGIRPIDVAAFRTLVDPAENEYLRCRLPAREFRSVQRKRLRATAAYIQVAAQNAAFLIHVGQMALAAPDPSTAEAARKLVDDALLLRRNAAFALLRIYTSMPWPTAGLAAAPILDGYSRLTGSAMLLGRLQNPAAPVRISAS